MQEEDEKRQAPNPQLKPDQVHIKSPVVYGVMMDPPSGFPPTNKRAPKKEGEQQQQQQPSPPPESEQPKEKEPELQNMQSFAKAVLLGAVGPRNNENAFKSIDQEGNKNDDDNDKSNKSDNSSSSNCCGGSSNKKDNDNNHRTDTGGGSLHSDSFHDYSSWDTDEEYDEEYDNHTACESVQMDTWHNDNDDDDVKHVNQDSVDVANTPNHAPYYQKRMTTRASRYSPLNKLPPRSVHPPPSRNVVIVPCGGSGGDGASGGAREEEEEERGGQGEGNSSVTRTQGLCGRQCLCVRCVTTITATTTTTTTTATKDEEKKKENKKKEKKNKKKTGNESKKDEVLIEIDLFAMKRMELMDWLQQLNRATPEQRHQLLWS